MDFSVPLDHVRQLFIIDKLGRHPGVWRNLLQIQRRPIQPFPNLKFLVSFFNEH